MATLDTLTTALTKEEVSAAIYAAVEARGISTTTWKSGSPTRTLIAGVAIVLAALSTLQALIAKSGFLELSAGDWLTVVARNVYGVERIVGTFASGSLTLDNTAGGVFAPGIGDIIALNTATGKTYRNTAAFTLAAFEVGKAVDFAAIEVGSGSSAAPAAIDDFETAMLGVTVTNALAFVGLDDEEDPALLTRARAKIGTLSPNGPSDAYAFLALSAATDGGASAGVTRVTTVPDGSGNVAVYVADAAGSLSGTVGDTTTPLGAVDESIQLLAVPLAVTATTISATPLAVPVTYEIWVRASSGLTVVEHQDAIAAALAAFMSTQAIGGSRKVPGGGFVFHQAIESVIGSTVGAAYLIDKTVTVPAADTAVAATEAPALSTLTPTVNLVSI